MFRLRSVLSALLVISMSIVTPFVATESAVAASITKTIDVKDAAGAPIANALVAIGYIDATTSTGYFTTSIQTTNGSGRATITLDSQLSSVTSVLLVEPAAGDTTHAMSIVQSTDGNFDLTASSTNQVTLPNSNLVVDLKSSDGTEDLPLFSSICFIDSVNTGVAHRSNVRILRQGPVGLYVDSSIGTTTEPLTVIPYGSTSTDGQTNYVLQATAGSSFALMVSNFFTSALQLPNGSGVITLQTLRKIFNFNLLQPGTVIPDTSVYAGTNSTYGYFFNEIYADGKGNYSAALPQNGQWRFVVHPNSGLTESKAVYLLTVTSGVASLERIFGASSSPLVPDTTSPIPHYNLMAGLPNITGNIIRASDGSVFNFPTNGNSYFSVTLQQLDSSGNAILAIGDGFYGAYSYEVRQPGTYQFLVTPNNVSAAGPSTSAPFTVDNQGKISSAVITTPQSTAVMDLQVSAPNINLTLTNGGAAIPTNLSGNFWVQVLQLVNGNWNYAPFNGFWTSSDQPNVSFNITTPGTYALRVNPYGMPQYGYTVGSNFTVSGNPGSTLISWPGLTPAATVNTNFEVGTSNLKFNIVNPLSPGGLAGGWIGIQQVIPAPQKWFGNIDIDARYATTASSALPDGDYQLDLNPPWSPPIPGLSANQYFASISNNGATVKLYKGTNALGILQTPVNGVYTLSAAIANVTGRFIDSTGIGLGQVTVGGVTSWSTSCLQQLAPDGVNWNWVTCSNTSADGTFNMSASTVGTYRVRLEPHGFKSVSVTLSDTFTVTTADLASNVTHSFGSIVALPSSINVVVTAAGTTTPVPNAQIEVRQGNNFYNWFGTDNAGFAAVGLTSAGSYTFIVHPNGNNSAYIPKSYAVTAIGSGSAVTATVDGLTPVGGNFLLPFGTQTLHGTVTTPPSGAPIFNSQVVATDEATNQDLWNYSTATGSDGTWSMYLPAGKYKIRAQAPWGNSDFGNSDLIGDVTVNASGVASLSGAASGFTANTFNLSLKAPYWSGTIYDPTGANPMRDTHVCADFIIAGLQTWNCSQTDTNGKWAMAMPADFPGTFDGNSGFRIAENQNAQYPMLMLRGAAELSAAGIRPSGSTGIRINLPKANVTLNVTAGGLPASNAWVNVFSANGGSWYAAGPTGANGVATFYISDLTQGLKFQVDPNSNPALAGKYSNTTQSFSTTTPTAGMYTASIALGTPNLYGKLIDPTASNAPVPYTWVDIYNRTTNTWMGGASTDVNGLFAMSVPASASGTDTYDLNANPQYQSASTGTRHTYTLTVDQSDSITAFTDPVTGLAVPIDPALHAPGYTITLLAPTVKGVVKDSTGVNTVPNSWVNVRDGAGFWLNYGSQTSSAGTFGLPLPGSVGGTKYLIQANAPQSITGQAVSSGCLVTVTTGVSAPTGSCMQNGSAVLTLSQPNFSVTVLDSQNHPVPQVNVGINLGMWNTGAQTDVTGVASLFIDTATIAALNPTFSGPQSFWLNIDPPYGSNNLVRTSCGSNQANTPCASNGLPLWTIGTSFSSTAMTVHLLGPNTAISVQNPDGSIPAVGTWVNLFSLDISNNWNWIGASGTDPTGKANFYISDTTTATNYVLVLDPAWNLRGTYSGGSYTGTSNLGYTWSALTSTAFKLHSPNIIFTIKDSNGAINRNGWIGVQTLDVSNNVTGWIGGYGLDQNGVDAVYLPTNGKFQVLMNPGPGSSGVMTTCQLTTNETGTVTVLPSCGFGTAAVTYDTPTVKTFVTAQLLSGNTSGRVVHSTSAVAGAIIRAVDTLNVNNVVITSTDVNGYFSMQLDPALHWNITVTPVNTPSDAVQLAPTIISNAVFGALGNIEVLAL